MSNKVFIVFSWTPTTQKQIEGVFKTLKAAMEAYPSRSLYTIEEWLVNK